MIRNQLDASGLHDGYTSFTFPNGAASMQRISAEDRPMHIKISWQASKPSTQDTVNVEWESRPLGGKLLSVMVKASSTDAAVNTRTIEDRLEHLSELQHQKRRLLMLPFSQILGKIHSLRSVKSK